MAADAYCANHEGSVGASWTTIPRVLTIFDIHAGSSGVWTATSDITVPKAGHYLIIAHCYVNDDDLSMRLLIDGSEVAMHVSEDGAAYDQWCGPQACDMRVLCKNSVIEFQARNDTGNTKTVYGAITVVRLPSPLWIGSSDGATTNTEAEWETEGGEETWWDAGDPERVTVPDDGVYLLSAMPIMNRLVPGSGTVTTLNKNGSAYLTFDKQWPKYYDGSGPAIVTLLELEAGDYLSLEADVAMSSARLGIVKLPDVPMALATHAGGDQTQSPHYPPVDIQLDSEEFDTHGFHSTSTNNERLTIPENTGGHYLFVGGVNVDGFIATGGLFDPSGPFSNYPNQAVMQAKTQKTWFTQHMVQDASEGDWASMQTWSDDAGGQVASRPRFFCVRLNGFTYPSSAPPCPPDFIPHIYRYSVEGR